MSSKEKIAQRAAAEIEAGQIINLGIGIPTLIPKYLEDHKQVIVHSENGPVSAAPRIAISSMPAEPM